MDKNKKKIITYATIVLLLLMPFLIFNYSHADSGWDTGYGGSGGSSGSSGSSGGSSSSGGGGGWSSGGSSGYDSSYRRSSSSGSGSGDPVELEFRDVFGIFNFIALGFFGVMFIIPDLADNLDEKKAKIYNIQRILELIVIPILFIIYSLYVVTTDEIGTLDYVVLINNLLCAYQLYLLIRKPKMKVAEELPIEDKYYDITPERLSIYLPGYSLATLKNELYQRFVDIQTAWMNFNYDWLRQLCTDELYNTYKSQLKVSEMKNEQNIMNNFNKNKIVIYDIDASSGMISVKVFLKVSFYDYVINRKRNVVTQGKKHKKITNHYEMVFVKSVNDPAVTICPNCNANINMVTSGECPYCGSTIIVPPNQLVLSKKTNLLTK